MCPVYGPYVPLVHLPRDTCSRSSHLPASIRIEPHLSNARLKERKQKSEQDHQDTSPEIDLLETLTLTPFPGPVLGWLLFVCYFLLPLELPPLPKINKKMDGRMEKLA